MIRRLGAPRERRETRIYNIRPGLWMFRAVAVPAVILGILCLISATQPTTTVPPGLWLFFAANTLLIGLSMLIRSVATDGSRTRMHVLTFWPYQRNLGQAYCDALNDEHTPLPEDDARYRSQTVGSGLCASGWRASR